MGERATLVDQLTALGAIDNTVPSASKSAEREGRKSESVTCLTDKTLLLVLQCNPGGRAAFNLLLLSRMGRPALHSP